jgi:hypothetical protein
VFLEELGLTVGMELALDHLVLDLLAGFLYRQFAGGCGAGDVHRITRRPGIAHRPLTSAGITDAFLQPIVLCLRRVVSRHLVQSGQGYLGFIGRIDTGVRAREAAGLQLIWIENPTAHGIGDFKADFIRIGAGHLKTRALLFAVGQVLSRCLLELRRRRRGYSRGCSERFLSP